MDSFKISYWPSATTTNEKQRTDVDINTFGELAALFKNPKTEPKKIHQKIITRVRQKSRASDNKRTKGKYLITLDYDSVKQEPQTIHDKLKDLEINHFIFTTWSHKSFEKKNNGLNCFKVLLELRVEKNELQKITNALGHVLEKDTNKSDDMSSGIFFGGTHPNHAQDFQFFYYDEGKPSTHTKTYLENITPKSKNTETPDPLDDDAELLGQYEKTTGQKYTKERIIKALGVINGRATGQHSEMEIWYKVGFALRSTQDDEYFDIWDNWCCDNYSEKGTYNREENEKFWDKPHIQKYDDMVSLSTLWYFEKIYNSELEKSKIASSEFDFFNDLAEQPFQEPPFLIKNLIVENTVGFLTGSGGVGKSTLCLEIAKAISSGESLLGNKKFPTKQGTVILINKEDSKLKIINQIHKNINHDTQNKLRIKHEFEDEGTSLAKEEITKIIDQWSNVARPHWSETTIRLSSDKGEELENIGTLLSNLEKMQQFLKESNRPPIRLIVFDPLNMWHGGDQNSQRDMSFIFSAFQQIQKKLNTTVLVVHHMNKSQGFSGSHTIRDSGRFMFYLRPVKLTASVYSDVFLEFYVDKSNDAKSNYTAMYLKRLEGGILELASQSDIDEEKSQLSKK